MKILSTFVFKTLAVVISFSFLICDELQSQSLPYIVRPTGINGPNALAFDTSGNLYVADYYNHCIKKVLPDGTTAGNVISLNDFDYPTSILFDKYGNSYIGCYGSNYIYLYNLAGLYALNLGGDSIIVEPRGMAFDTKGILYLASLDTLGNGIVSKINTSNYTITNFIPASAGLKSPQGLAFDSFDNLYVADDSTQTIYKITPSGNISIVIRGYSAEGLSFDTSGNLYFADRNSASIIKVASNGTYSTFYTFLTGGLTPPEALVFDKIGNLYEAGLSGNIINKLTNNGSITRSVFATFLALSTPEGMTATRLGNAFYGSFVVSDYSNNTISVIDANRNTSTLVSASSGINGPVGLAYDNFNNLYVANSGDNTILKIAPDTTVSVFVPKSAGLSYPSGIVMDYSGNMYVSSVGSGTITKITPSGNASIYVPSNAGLLEPDAIAVDNIGNLYVSNHDSTNFKGIISKVAPDGSISTLVPSSAGLSPSSLVLGPNIYYATSLFATTWDNTIVEIDQNNGTVLSIVNDSNLNKPDAIINAGVCSFLVANAGSNSVLMFGTCDPLPVTLLDFAAKPIGKQVALHWQTATELNTSHFIIQRSTDGSSFKDIGTVKAIGSGANSYSFTDKNPVNGINYYRLESVDKDGASTFSKVVSASLTIDDSRLTIYPNPAKDNVTIKGSHIASVQVIDNMGRVVKVVSLKDATNPVLSVSSLAAGVYHLRIQTIDGEVSGSQLIIIK